jgi:hypothetical protein
VNCTTIISDLAWLPYTLIFTFSRPSSLLANLPTCRRAQLGFVVYRLLIYLSDDGPHCIHNTKASVSYSAMASSIRTGEIIIISNASALCNNRFMLCVITWFTYDGPSSKCAVHAPECSTSDEDHDERGSSSCVRYHHGTWQQCSVRKLASTFQS